MVWYSHLFKSFSQFVMIHTDKGFSAINETEVDFFLEFPCFLYDPENGGNLISDSSAFSKPRLNIWKFSIHVMLKPSMEDFEHNLTSMEDECSCPRVWTFLSTSQELGWGLTFSSLVTFAGFSSPSRDLCFPYPVCLKLIHTPRC